MVYAKGQASPPSKQETTSSEQALSRKCPFEPETICQRREDAFEHWIRLDNLRFIPPSSTSAKPPCTLQHAQPESADRIHHGAMSRKISLSEAEAYELPLLRGEPGSSSNPNDEDIPESARLLDEYAKDDSSRGDNSGKDEVTGKGSSVEELIARVRPFSLDTDSTSGTLPSRIYLSLHRCFDIRADI